MPFQKRVFDLVSASIGLLILSPVLLLIASLILMSSGRPVLYRQQRVGYLGRPFYILKFRTMVRDAAKYGNLLTIGNDPRITKIGKLLRKTKLDELAQIINVLKGEMSFVGPRPEVQKYVDMYNEQQLRVLSLVPGITDPASIKYRDENTLLGISSDPERLYIEQIMPDKIEINQKYAQRASVTSDIIIIFKTILGREHLHGTNDDCARHSSRTTGTSSHF